MSIRYQLPSGRCISVSYEYLEQMTDLELNELSHSNIGGITENPFNEKTIEENEDNYDATDIDIPDTSINFDETIDLD